MTSSGKAQQVKRPGDAVPFAGGVADEERRARRRLGRPFGLKPAIKPALAGITAQNSERNRLGRWTGHSCLLFHFFSNLRRFA
jgi:hypothetical protein